MAEQRVGGSGICVLGIVSGMACACGGLEPSSVATEASFPIVLSARDEAGDALAGVRVVESQRVVGQTDANGRAQITLSGAEGQIVAMDVVCPEGYSAPDRPIQVGLRRMSEGSPAPVFETSCIAQLHSVVVGVRVEGAVSVPILYLKRAVAETDLNGVAHVLLRVPPAQAVTLTLDTTRNPALRPQNPTLTFVAPEHDEMVLFEQRFTEQVAPRRVQRRAVPQRI